MANNIITPLYIASKTLQIAHNNSALLRKINTDYNDEFAVKGAKRGSTINIRLPNSYTIRNGPVVNLQDSNERTVPLTIQPEFGVDMVFSDYDMTLSVDRFTERYIKPAGMKLATELDTRITGMFKQVANQVGTPGTPPTTVQGMQDLWLAAGEKLDAAGAPMNMDRMAILGPRSNRSVVSLLNLGFNNQALIGQQYRTGEMGEALGFDFSKSQNAPSFTTGPGGGTPLVNGANQGTINTGSTDNPYAGTTSLVTNGWTAAAALRAKQGDVISIAGVFDVNTESKATLPYLKDFVLTADASSDGAGNVTLIISPAINAGGAYQNVSARPVPGAAITINHNATANTQYDQSLAFYKDAFTLVTVDMELPKGMDMAERVEYDGVSVRFVRGYDIVNNRYISRLDVLAGYACLRPDWAVRVFTA